MKTERQCGTCSLCCKLLGVPEVKEDFTWCPHCRMPGGGCSIYATRPAPCRDYKCQWLVDERFGAHWFPAKAKILIDRKLEDEKAYVIFVVDPDYPTRWREEPWHSDIRKIAKAGLNGVLGINWITVVSIRDKRLVIGP